MKKYFLILLIVLIPGISFSQTFEIGYNNILNKEDTTVMKADMTPIQAQYFTKTEINNMFSSYSTTSQVTNLFKASNDTTTNSGYATRWYANSLIPNLTNYFNLTNKNTVADSTTFNDNILVNSVIPNATNTYVLGNSTKQFTTAYFQSVPKIGNIDMNDIVTIGNSSSAGVVGLLGVLAVNKRTITLRNGVTFDVLVLP